MIEIAYSEDLSPELRDAIQGLNHLTWPDYKRDYWADIGAGTIFFVRDGDAVVSEAAVVPRELHCGTLMLRTGYVESVCTRADRQRRGMATEIMRAVNDFVRARFELGGLSTGDNAFYERLGWETWRGPTSYRTTGDTSVRTEDEDGGVMILRTPATPALDLDAPISCEWRPGEIW